MIPRVCDLQSKYLSQQEDSVSPVIIHDINKPQKNLTLKREHGMLPSIHGITLISVVFSYGPQAY